MMNFNGSTNFSVSVNVDTETVKNAMHCIASDIVAISGCMWVDDAHVTVKINDNTVSINGIMCDTVTDGYGTYNYTDRYNDEVVDVLAQGLYEGAMMNSSLLNPNGTFNAFAISLNKVADNISVSVALDATPGVRVSFDVSLVWRINAICHTEVYAYPRLVTR